MRTLNRSECSILPLVLKGKWYDMIASGEKREEYRDAKPYWTKRLRRWAWRDDRKTLVVAFSLGYRKADLFFRAHPKPFSLDGPYPVSTIIPEVAWGQPLGKEHYVIALDERVELEARP